MHPLLTGLAAERGEIRLIFLRDFAVEARIGIHAFEREKPQRLLINVELALDGPPPARDTLAEVLDYDFLRTGIARLVAERHYDLQETLVHEIVELCLAKPQVQGVAVSTEKPDVYPDCAGIGYAYARIRKR